MNKNLFFLKNIFFTLLCSFFFNYCSDNSSEIEYVRGVRNGDFKARIVVDSSTIYRNNRNNGELSVDINYRAVLLDKDIDSLEWLFPNGNPPNEKETMSTSVNYSNYGKYISKLVLTKVDTVNLNSILSYKDTIEISRPVEIVFKESKWDSYISSDESNWGVLPNSQNVIIKENQIFDESTPSLTSAAFSGFMDQRLKFSIEYKLTYKNYLENIATSNPKLEILIDDLKAFGVSRVTNDTYFTQDFYVNNLSDFNFIIKKYPALSVSEWQLSITDSGTLVADVEIYNLVNQNRLIGYLDLTDSTTSSATSSFNAILKTTSNGNEFNFGISLGQTLVLDGDAIQIEPGNIYKIIFNLEDGLPNSYQIINDKFTNVPITLEENEYYLDATIRRLYINID